MRYSYVIVTNSIASCFTMSIGTLWVLLLLNACEGSTEPSARDQASKKDASANDASTPVASGSAAVVLNEVDCYNRDWVEIANTGETAANLNGWIIGDDQTDVSHQYTLPAGTVIGPGAFLVVREQKDTEPGFSFGLKCVDDTVYLMNGAKTVVDSIRIGDVPNGSTWGRLPDTKGQWQETGPTQGGTNQDPPKVADVLFDLGAVNTIALTLPKASVTALTNEPYTYAEAQIEVTTAAKKSALTTVGIRLKSGLSFQPLDKKPAFRIKANEYVPTNRVFGLKRITLNNMVQDASMMSEAIAYSIFRAAGLSAIRSGYAKVTVNGESYGLYAVVENYDGLFSDRHFEGTNHVYEGMGDLLPTEVANIEVDQGSSTDTSDLTALISAVNDTSDKNWFATVGKLIDLNAFALFWAVENYVGQIDGYTIAANNYYLHSSNANLFTMMPWGADRCFAEKILFPTCDRVLCKRCGAIDSCAALYDAALDTVVTAVGALDLDALITKIEATVAAAVEEDSRKKSTVDEHKAAVQSLRDFLATRLSEAKAVMAKSP